MGEEVEIAQETGKEQYVREENQDSPSLERLGEMINIATEMGTENEPPLGMSVGLRAGNSCLLSSQLYHGPQQRASLEVINYL